MSKLWNLLECFHSMNLNNVLQVNQLKSLEVEKNPVPEIPKLQNTEIYLGFVIKNCYDFKTRFLNKKRCKNVPYFIKLFVILREKRHSYTNLHSLVKVNRNETRVHIYKNLLALPISKENNLQHWKVELPCIPYIPIWLRLKKDKKEVW